MRYPTTHANSDTRMKELIEIHRLPLIRFVLHLTQGEHHTAEDIVQETIIRAWQSQDRLPDDEEGIRRWLRTVAHRLLIDHVRRQKVRRSDLSANVEGDQPSGSDDVSLTVVAADSFRQALSDLALPQRQVIHEIFVRNRTTREVADLLNIPIGTVRSRQHYAIQALRQAMLG
jgi:RNA polymerase sigma-70 factor (ECF subfamily)